MVVLLLVAYPAAAGVGYHTFAMSTGETLEESVQAGASVEANATANTTTVTWTSNQNADHLLVQLPESGSELRVANTVNSSNTTGGVNVTDDGVRLTEVGQQVTFRQRRPSENATVEVVVVAAKGDARTVIVARDVEL